MTDKEKLINLLSEFGVSFKNESDKITIGTKTGPKNIGYLNFECEWNFIDDKFLNVGIWE